MVESIGAVCSYFVSGTDEQAEHLYISEPQKLAYCKTQADALMRLSAPLMNIYNNKNSEEFSPIVEEFSRQKGNSVAIFPSLPVCTMSEKLIDSILERENVDEETSAAIREFCTLRKLLFKKSLAGHTSFMLPIPPAYIENGIRFSSNHFLNTDNIYYTKEEYNEHIRTIIEILKRENNLDFVLLDDSKLRHTQILSKENGGVLITKCTAPVTAMYFTHPFICKSIHGYLKKIAESIAPADKNKYDIIRLLEQQLNN